MGGHGGSGSGAPSCGRSEGQALYRAGAPVYEWRPCGPLIERKGMERAGVSARVKGPACLSWFPSLYLGSLPRGAYRILWPVVPARSAERAIPQKESGTRGGSPGRACRRGMPQHKAPRKRSGGLCTLSRDRVENSSLRGNQNICSSTTPRNNFHFNSKATPSPIIARRFPVSQAQIGIRKRLFPGRQALPCPPAL